MTVTFQLEELQNFIGTEHHYFHPLFRNGLRYTDGVQHISANGCGWFVELILAENIRQPNLLREEFQAWALTAHPNGGGSVTVDDGNGNLLWRKSLDFTDWPVGDPLTVWVSNGVILLPSEY